MEQQAQPGRNGKRILLMHLGLFAVILAWLAVMVGFKIYCPIRHITGIPCAGCGMSRALVCLLRLDIKGSLHQNPALVPCMTALFLLLHRDTRLLAGWNRRLLYACIAGGFGFTLVTYVVRLAFFAIP